MKQLEDRIMEDMFRTETRMSAVSLVIRSALFVLAGAVLVLFGQVLWEVFAVEKTFGVFEIFTDSAEVVWKHLGDILGVVAAETPKEILAVIFGAGLISGVLLLTFILHFGKIRNKTMSLARYWKRKLKG